MCLAVLAAGSEVLKSTLTMQQSNSILKKQGIIAMIVDGVSCSTWQLLLDFLYLRSLSVQLSDSELIQLFVAAKMLGIRNLKASLEQFIATLNIKIDEELYNTKEVKIKLMRKPVNHSKVVTNDDSGGDVKTETAAATATASANSEDDDDDFASEGDAELGHYEGLHFTVETNDDDKSMRALNTRNSGSNNSTSAMNGHHDGEFSRIINTANNHD